MKKEVEILIGVPCSGKSTYIKKNNNPEDIFIISRDDIRNKLIENTEYVYSDFFVAPKVGDVDSEKYGKITKEGAWSNVLDLNKELKSRFEQSIEDSKSALNSGKKVIVDLVNLTEKERNDIKNWFKETKDVEFSAVVFDYENNLSIIEEQNEKRGLQENKMIPFFVIEKMIEGSDPVSSSEFSKITRVDGLEQLKKEKKLENKLNKKSRKNKLR